MNQTFKYCLKAVSSDLNLSCDQAIEKVTWFYNSKPHDTTGESPHYVFSLRPDPQNHDNYEELNKVMQVGFVAETIKQHQDQYVSESNEFTTYFMN